MHLQWSVYMAASDLWSKTLSDQSFHESGFFKGPVILVGNRSVHIALKEGEHWEPNARPPALLVSARVG